MLGGAKGGSPEVEDQRQRLVHPMRLVNGEKAGRLGEASQIDGKPPPPVR